MGFTRKLLREDFEEVLDDLVERFVPTADRHSIKKLAINLRSNTSLVFESSSAAENFLQAAIVESTYWVDRRTNEKIELRVRRDKPLKDRALGRLMGHLWKRVMSQCSEALSEGHLGSSRGVLFFKQGRELYELCDIQTDTTADSLVVTGVRCSADGLALAGLSEAQLRAFAEQGMELLGITRL